MEVHDQILLDRQLSVLYAVLGIRPEHSTILTQIPPPPLKPATFAPKRRVRAVEKVKIDNEIKKSEEESFEKEENSAVKPTTRNKSKPTPDELVLTEVKYPAPCKFCGKLQKNVHVLTHHEMIHTGEKPHVCMYCSRAFAWKQSWKSHQMRCETKSEKSKTQNQTKVVHANNSHSKENQSVKVQNRTKLQSTRSTAAATFKASFNQRGRNRNVQGYSARAQAADVQKAGTPKKNLGKENQNSKPKFSFKSSISASVTKIKNKKKRSIPVTAKSPKTKRRIRRGSKSAKTGAFSCKICQQRSRSIQELILHERVHTGEQPFSCKYCLKKFGWKQNRDIHELKVCKLRGMTAKTKETSKSDLKNGARARTGTGLAVDVLCNGNNNSNIQTRKRGRPKGSLTTRTRTKASNLLKTKATRPSQGRKKKDKPSQILPKTKVTLKSPASEPSTSTIKLKLKLPSFNFSCKYCLKRFCKYSELELHERQSHIFNVKSYSCNSCPRRFISNSPCQNHQKLHDMMCKIKYKIKIHDKFGPYRHYRVHKLTKNRRRQSQNHLRVLDGNENETENPEPPPAALTLPFAEFMGIYGGLNEQDNNNHNIQIVNAGAGTSTGSGSGTNSKTKGKESHLSRARVTNEGISRIRVDGILKFRCNQCQKVLGRNRSAVRHLQTHNRNRDRDRKRREPKLPKQHTCSFCSRVFGQKGNLTVHERIHTGEEPYACQGCKKTFKSLAGLSYHLGKYKNGATCCVRPN